MNSQGVVDVEYLGNQILNNPAPGDSDASLGHSPVIRISTIHKAKGLEFDHVLVLEPDYQRLIGSVEESKIMYVGITRGVHSVKLLENRRFKGIRSTKGGQWHSRSGDGKGLFVDGLEEIDIATVLELPGGSFLGEEQFKLRQTALRDYAGARRIGLHIPAGADRHWLFADDGMGVSTPICAVSKNLDRDIKKLPGHHRQREYQADIEGMVTVAFNREDSTARALLGPARVVNVPLLSGSLVCLVPNPQEGR